MVSNLQSLAFVYESDLVPTKCLSSLLSDGNSKRFSSFSHSYKYGLLFSYLRLTKYRQVWNSSRTEKICEVAKSHNRRSTCCVRIPFVYESDLVPTKCLSSLLSDGNSKRFSSFSHSYMYALLFPYLRLTKYRKYVVLGPKRSVKWQES